MRLSIVTIVVALLSTIVPTYTQDTAAPSKAPVVKVSDFKPPLSAGKQRKYDQTASTVANAVRDAMKSGQFKLLSEQTAGSMTVFAAITNSERNMQERDKVRIVVEPLSEKQTALRVLWRAASSFSPTSSAENLYFQAIESRLK